MTLVGPHRDDLVLHLGPAPAKGFASHGESWSLALALKLACFGLFRADGEDPILVLDDVFATLDADRRAALAAVARSAEQTLITAAVLDDVPPELRATRVEVAGGRAWVVAEGAAIGGRRRDDRRRGREPTRRWAGGERRASAAAQRRRPAPRSRPPAPPPPPARSRPAAGSPDRGARGPAPARAPTTRSCSAGCVDSLVTDQDWSQHTTVGSVFGRWAALVGDDVAAHCAPADADRGRAAGRRRVHRLGDPAAAARAADPRQAAGAVGGDVVTRLRVVGPTAPSWKKGPRTVRGRGPRDTYG